MVSVAVMVKSMRSGEHGTVGSARVLDVHIRIRLPSGAVLRTEIVVLMRIAPPSEFEYVPIDMESRCVRVVSADAELRDNQTVVYSSHPDHVAAYVTASIKALPPEGVSSGQLRGGGYVAVDDVRIVLAVQQIGVKSAARAVHGLELREDVGRRVRALEQVARVEGARVVVLVEELVPGAPRRAAVVAARVVDLSVGIRGLLECESVYVRDVWTLSVISVHEYDVAVRNWLVHHVHLQPHAVEVGRWLEAAAARVGACQIDGTVRDGGIVRACRVAADAYRPRAACADSGLCDGVVGVIHRVEYRVGIVGQPVLADDKVVFPRRVVPYFRHFVRARVECYRLRGVPIAYLRDKCTACRTLPAESCSVIRVVVVHLYEQMGRIGAAQSNMPRHRPSCERKVRRQCWRIRFVI